MLTGIDIRDVVLIDRLTLEFEGGLTALTGETGAGKSILLDALGLALGARADAGLVRKGAEQAVVSASFVIPCAHPALALLQEQGFDTKDATLILRRILGADGRSRAFINDQPVSIGLLRQTGAMLVEIHGQFETQGLLEAATHRSLLDAFGAANVLRAQVLGAWNSWQETQTALKKAKDDMLAAAREEDWLRHVLAELDQLAPQPGETQSLSDQRARLMNREQFSEAAETALQCLEGDKGIETLLARAQSALEKAAVKTGIGLDSVISALDRAGAELAEAGSTLRRIGGDLDYDSARQENIEERLFALRDCARKHGCAEDDLPAHRAALAQKLALIDNQSRTLQELETAVVQTRQAYMTLAQKLSATRKKAAQKLDRAVTAELAPLKLEKARFETSVQVMELESGWGPAGMDSVAFLVATNPGTDPGLLSKIASGGELARFMLALKVVLARAESPPVLVFDEADTGVGGAVAAAVGERLARLGQDFQVFCVTHSPQVAARAGHHLVVSKQETKTGFATSVTSLLPQERQEEIARMLSGAKITTEARAAAASLMEAREHVAA